MLVGRETEVAELRRAIHDRRPLIVLGEAGVGKTAVVREAARRSECSLVEAGAFATLSWLPYLPFQRVFGRTPSGDAAYVAAEVERATGDGLLFLDDVHWADRETHATIPLLAGRIRVVAALRRGDPATGTSLESLGEAGFELMPLEPLAEAAATEFARVLRPGLGRKQVDALVRRTGGNPLLLEELATSGEPTESLQLALAARLRQLSAAGREAMGLLSLAGRPLEADALGEAGAELVDAGLAVHRHDTLAARHALLAEAAVTLLSAEERPRLHRRLAEFAQDPGERARHYAGGGDRTRAYAEAMRAVSGASTPAERASHLEIAALALEGPEADRLRLEAAQALSEVALDEQALTVLEQVAATDAATEATRHLYRSRVRRNRRDVEGARAEFEAGLDLVAGSGSEIEARLALEDAQMAQRRVLLFDLEPRVARAKAEHALGLARGSADLEARALCVVGSIGLLSQAPGWDDELRVALDLAKGSASPDLEFSIAAGFGFGLLLSGRLDEALELHLDSIERAVARRLAVCERWLRNGLVSVHWHAGALRDALAELEALEADAPERPSFYAAQVLADLGRHDGSLSHARQLVARGLPTWEGLGNALWALSDAELAAGHAGEALAAADEALERFGTHGPTAFLQLTRAWALHDLGRFADSAALEAGQPIAQGAPIELAGLRLLAEQKDAEAAAVFVDAAARWQGRHFRGHLRCLWAAGEAARRAGDEARAVAALEAAETVALEHEEVPLLRRIRRSLRLAGQRRTARRGAAGELTLREREVLALVAEGSSNADIARRLGVGRPTIERLVQSASRKLGARTRAQAAALAQSE